jgi:hypothetical protein
MYSTYLGYDVAWTPGARARARALPLSVEDVHVDSYRTRGCRARCVCSAIGYVPHAYRPQNHPIVIDLPTSYIDPVP